MYNLEQIKELINNTPEEFDGRNINEFNSWCVGRCFAGNMSNICSIYNVHYENKDIKVVTNRGTILTKNEQIPVKRTDLSLDVIKKDMKIIESEWEEEWRKIKTEKGKKISLSQFKDMKREARFAPETLNVKKGSKKYKLLNTRISDANFCDDTKRFCKEHGINYIGELVVLEPINMVPHWLYLIDKELKILGLSINMKLSEWHYPITRKQSQRLKIPLSNVDLPKRVEAVAKEEKWETLKDIATCTKRNLIRYPNCGKGVVDEIDKLLAQYGLELGMEVD